MYQSGKALFSENSVVLLLKNLLSFPSCFITANSYVIVYQEAAAMAGLGGFAICYKKVTTLLNVFENSKCIASIQSSVSNVFVNLLTFFFLLHSP